MWAGWFSLIMVGLGVLTFQIHKIGHRIIASDGIGSMYFQWVAVTILPFGMAIGSAVMFMYVLGDTLTISFVSMGIAAFFVHTWFKYHELKRYNTKQPISDNAGIIHARVILYKQFFLIFLMLLVAIVVATLLFSIYLIYL